MIQTAFKRFLRRCVLPLFALALAALSLAGGSLNGSAAPYVSASFHYRFEYPDGWTMQTSDGIDIIIKGAASGGFQPNIVAQNEIEDNASEATVWLQTYVQNSFIALGARINLTVVQAPRTFTTAAGKLAGDYTFDQQSHNLTIRQRQVFFVSQAEHRTYFLTFTDKSSSFQTHDGEWNKAADTFTVETTAAAGNWLLQPVGLASVAAMAAGALLVVVVVRRRKSRGEKSDAARP